MSDRNFITAYLNNRHQVIRKTRSSNPVAATERAGGYLANQYFRNSQNPNEFAVYAEVYHADTTKQFSSIKFHPGSAKVNTTYNENPMNYETRYAVTPLLE